MEASRLQLTPSSERAAGGQVTSNPEVINQTEQREDNIWFQESLSVGHQLKPEQCDKRSGSQRQSKPLVFEGADHVASAVAPINRAFSQMPTSADPLLPNRCHHQGTSHSGAHLAGRGSARCGGDPIARAPPIWKWCEAPFLAITKAAASKSKRPESLSQQQMEQQQ